MAFCSSCGNEVKAGAAFCGSCGAKQVVSAISCINCGQLLEEHDKFCPACGTPVADTTKSKTNRQPDSKQTDEKLTEEGKKIISGGPKPQQNKYSQEKPPLVVQSKRKKRGCFGCFFRTSLIILILISLFIGGKFILGKINTFSGKNTVIGRINSENVIKSAIPGGNELRKNEKNFEGDELKKVLNELETALDNADLEKLKLLLSDYALLKYEDELLELKPRLEKYAKAFKKRKLVLSADFFKTYEFSDDDGMTYTVTLEFQPGETWKITHL